MHTREHHSDTATDVSVAELLARYLRAMDGDCDSEPVDYWVRNNATYDKLIPAVRRTFAIPASSAPVERVFSHEQSKNVPQTFVWTGVFEVQHCVNRFRCWTV